MSPAEIALRQRKMWRQYKRNMQNVQSVISNEYPTYETGQKVFVPHPFSGTKRKCCLAWNHIQADGQHSQLPLPLVKWSQC